MLLAPKLWYIKYNITNNQREKYIFIKCGIFTSGQEINSFDEMPVSSRPDLFFTLHLYSVEMFSNSTIGRYGWTGWRAAPTDSISSRLFPIRIREGSVYQTSVPVLKQVERRISTAFISFILEIRNRVWVNLGNLLHAGIRESSANRKHQWPSIIRSLFQCWWITKQGVISPRPCWIFKSQV